MVSASDRGGRGRRSSGHTAHDLRTDRFLDQVHAAGGDPIALMHLFGISDTPALRYRAEVTVLDPRHHPDPGP